MTKEILTVAPFLTSAVNFTQQFNAGSSFGPLAELIGIKVGVANVAGSLQFTESGITPRGIFTLAVASGTNAVGIFFPVESRVSSGNVALWSGGNIFTPFVVTRPLTLVGSAFTSGTTNFISGIEVILQR